MYAFRNLQQVRDQAGDWLVEYNYDRGHDALGGKSPVEYARSFSPLTLNAQAKGRKGKNCYVCGTLQL
jgi:putative transposase